MKRIVFVDDVTGVDGQKRLDHYNEWLRDPKRPFTSIYPGYPDDKPEQKRKTKKVTVAKKS